MGEAVPGRVVVGVIGLAGTGVGVGVALTGIAWVVRRGRSCVFAELESEPSDNPQIAANKTANTRMGRVMTVAALLFAIPE